MNKWTCAYCDHMNSIQFVICESCYIAQECFQYEVYDESELEDTMINVSETMTNCSKLQLPKLQLTSTLPTPFAPKTEITIPNSPKPMEPFDINKILSTTLQTELITIDSQSDSKSSYYNGNDESDDDNIPTTNLMGSFTPKYPTTLNHFDSKSKVNMDVINNLMDKQQILFQGFLRFYEVCNIPLDVIRLCLKFYQLNIDKICYDLHKERTAIFSNCDEIIDENNNVISYDDLYELAMILRTQKDCFIAYEIMNDLIEQNSNLSEYHNAMGLILKKWNCYDLAEKHYKIAIKNEENENIYRWNYGLLLQELNKYDLALKQFIFAIENVDEKQSEYIFESAYCYQKLGDKKNATINYLRAIELNCYKSSYWIHYAQYLCQELNDYKYSIECFEKAISIEPNNITYYYRFARNLRDFHKNYEKSKVYYQKCISMLSISDDDNIVEIIGLNASYGYLLYLMKDYKSSKKYLCLSQETDPMNAWSYYYFGMLILQCSGNKEKANNLMDKALRFSNTYSSMIEHLNRIKKIDKSNVEYHNKFQLLLKEKFGL